MREEFEKLALAGKINNKHIEVLVQLAQGGYCMHRSWGFGRITTVDTVFARFSIDFPGKAGHSMDLSFAADSLKPIPKDHILARKAADLNSLRQMAALHHLDLIKVVLGSFGGSATVDQIQNSLVPDVIASDWKKWWEVAKREMKKDGHFLVPLKKSDPVVMREQTVSMQDRLTNEFRAAKGLKAKLVVASEIHKSLEDIKERNTVVTEVISQLNADIQSHQRTMPALALEAIFLRDDLRQACNLTAQPGEVVAKDVWAGEATVKTIMESMSAAKYRRALQSYQEGNPNTWQDVVLSLLNQSSAKLCSECAAVLLQSGKINELKATLARMISQHMASSELLLWLAKERSDTFADILGPEVFRAMLTAMERDQFNEIRSNRLRDFILDDPTLLVELIGSADLEVIRDLTRALQLSPSFDDMDKRSLLARIVKNYPSIQSLITGETSKQDSGLVVSWESLERRKAEYEELVQKKMPANRNDIAIARSYGDLRENHEYKSAKEMQKILMRRKAELEVQLVRARGSDFANPKTEEVSIGTIVKVTNIGSGSPENFTLLGAWDSDPDKGIISYLSPVGQALIGHKIGDEVEIEIEGAKRKFRIEGITAWKAA
jgi:transcription elongation GreA/GreB family factor/transcription elongation factor GreA-like protein